MRLAPLILALVACSSRSPEESSGWFDSGSLIDVEEAISYTDEAYTFAGTGTTFADLGDIFLENSNFLYAEGDEYGWSGAECGSSTTSDLPVEIEGIVTIHPRMYIKSSGCDIGGQPYSDEKYYGSFFIEDNDGAVFVLGDSKVAHFDAGNKVRMRVRAIRNSFDLKMVYAWDIVEIDYEKYPVKYELASGEFSTEDIAKTKRVVGTVMSEPDTFGQFLVAPDDAFSDTDSEPSYSYFVSLDSELTRRGYKYPIGSRIQATGPVLFSYSEYNIVVMNVGQITELD